MCERLTPYGCKPSSWQRTLPAIGTIAAFALRTLVSEVDMLRLIMRVTTIMLMLVCAAAVDHAGAHTDQSPQVKHTIVVTGGHGILQPLPVSAPGAFAAVFDASPESEHPCAVSSTAAKFAWTTTTLTASVDCSDRSSARGLLPPRGVGEPQRELLLMVCVCRT